MENNVNDTGLTQIENLENCDKAIEWWNSKSVEAQTALWRIYFRIIKLYPFKSDFKISAVTQMYALETKNPVSAEDMNNAVDSILEELPSLPVFEQLNARDSQMMVEMIESLLNLNGMFNTPVTRRAATDMQREAMGIAKEVIDKYRLPELLEQLKKSGKSH